MTERDGAESERWEDARMTESVIRCPVSASAQATAPRRVLMITYDFPPSRTAASVVCEQMTRYLPRYGWEPIVLTVRERYFADGQPLVAQPFPPVVIRTRVIPHPLVIYKRLKRWLGPRAQNGDGAPTAHTSLREKGLLRRSALSVLRVPDEYTGWILPAVAAGMRAIRRYGIEQVVSSSPHSTGQLVGLALSRLRGLPWTAHFQDPWTHPWRRWRESGVVTDLSARLETALERMVLRRADVVACVTDPHTNWLRQRYPQVANKFITIPNGFDSDEWERLDGARQQTGQDKFVITYAGSLYLQRSPLPLFRALRSLIDSGDIVREDIQVDLIGQCDVAEGARVTDIAASCALLGNVRVTGLLDRAATLLRMAQSNLLLLLAEGWTLQIPLKTYEYLRAGRPILALTSTGAVADLLSSAGGAWVVDPTDQAGIRGAVREAYWYWRNGVNGPRPDPDVVAGFDRRVLVGRFAEAFEAAAASRRAAS